MSEYRTFVLPGYKGRRRLITDFYLQDEEEEVREAAASFASDLPRVQTEVLENIKNRLDE